MSKLPQREWRPPCVGRGRPTRVFPLPNSCSRCASLTRGPVTVPLPCRLARLPKGRSGRPRPRAARSRRDAAAFHRSETRPSPGSQCQPVSSRGVQAAATFAFVRQGTARLESELEANLKRRDAAVWPPGRRTGSALRAGLARTGAAPPPGWRPAA